jgi:hypothetical protein
VLLWLPVGLAVGGMGLSFIMLAYADASQAAYGGQPHMEEHTRMYPLGQRPQAPADDDEARS